MDSADLFMPAERFLLELAREMSRSNRRQTEREFALIVVTPVDFEVDSAPAQKLLSSFHARLRITDSIGLYENQIGVLLPETRKMGAMQVANELLKIAGREDQRIETDIFVYPWDDELASKANELVELPRNESGLTPAEILSGDELDSLDQERADDSDVDADQETELRRAPNDHSLMVARLPFDVRFSTPWWKRLTDIVGAGMLLVFLSPLLLLAALAIKLSSRGPVLFRQLREGKDGQQFWMYKFRTMIVDADTQKIGLREQSQQDGPAFKMDDDPRITRVGRYLRKSCADELPQLLNVMLGHMSLVGPRPLPVDESLECRPWQRYRLRVLPGLTCIWQVEGGRQTKFSDWMRMDMRYLQKRGFLYDLRLICRTAIKALLHRGSV